MTNVALREYIRKYLGLTLRYLTSQLGNTPTSVLVDMWDDIKNFTQTTRIKNDKKNTPYSIKHGSSYSWALDSEKFNVNRLDFLKKLLKVRYYIEDLYKIQLHNLPYYYF